ncbi:MAG TPA: hypothetical protein VD793_01725 [Gemmatimonadales bacterium]|nr:hypothetical protein [Gemmatimonadales bacterium]
MTRAWVRCALALGLLLGCAPPQSEAPAKNTLVLGLDVSGSFRPHYDDAINFAAMYLYGHLNGLGGLRAPTALFVGSVGGESSEDVKSFHPIHDFRGKSVEQIAADLRQWFPSQERYTDFNVFFDRAATLIKRQNLVLSPLNIVVLSDGLPDDQPVEGDTLGPYGRLDLEPLEYLSRSVTVRLLYPTPTVAVRWERGAKRRRVRLWTLDNQVMAGWRGQLAAGQPPEAQDNLWQWVSDNVNFRVRARIL